MSFKQVLLLMALSLTLQTQAESPSVRRLQDESAKLAEANKLLISALRELTTETGVGNAEECYNSCRQTGGSYAECTSDCYEEFVGQKFDRCATRTMCVAECVADDESKRFECLKDVCPKEMCTQEESVGQLDRCARRTMCVADCVAGNESKRFECLKHVCPKELCVEATVAQEKKVGADNACRDTSAGGPPDGWHCDSRWEHVVWWNELHTYCRSDKPGRGCKYGYFRSGLHDYCCMKVHWDYLDICECW